LFGVDIALMFGVIGYILNKFGFPLPPILMGIILGPIAEESLRQSLVVSNGSWTILFTQPISAVFLGVTALIVLCKAYLMLFKKDGD
jgi:putative tricarboxylic transport membrane protein